MKKNQAILTFIIFLLLLISFSRYYQNNQLVPYLNYYNNKITIINGNIFDLILLPFFMILAINILIYGFLTYFIMPIVSFGIVKLSENNLNVIFILNTIILNLVCSYLLSYILIKITDKYEKKVY